jgi:thioredoxin reductase (NADPH)
MDPAKEKPKIILEPRREFDYSADSKIFYDMIIVGAGVAGLACAMYAGRLGLKVLVVGELQGGTITLTNSVENFPGFISIGGSELGRLMENHAKDYDIDILSAKVKKIGIHKKLSKKHFQVFSGKKSFFSKTLVMATGTEVRKLGVPGEKEFENKGVSYCALCDGPLFKDKIIGVVGGGDSAIKEAILLAEYGKKVYIIHRGENIRPERQNLLGLNEKIKAGKIEIIKNTNVIEIKGDSIIKSVVLDREYNGSKEFVLGGLFVYIGHIPLNELVKGLKVKLNKKGEIIINKNSETSIRGLYAAGDITDGDWKQAITGVAEGVKAAYYAYQYVSDGKYILPPQKIKQ